MHPIQKKREDVANNASNNGCDDDERDGRRNFKILDDNWCTDHMRPHTEIGNRLSPSERDKDWPHKVQSAHHLADGKPGLGRINMMIHNDMLFD